MEFAPDNKQSILIVDSKERVAFELYEYLRPSVYDDEQLDKNANLELYKECLRAVLYPNK